MLINVLTDINYIFLIFLIHVSIFINFFQSAAILRLSKVPAFKTLQNSIKNNPVSVFFKFFDSVALSSFVAFCEQHMCCACKSLNALNLFSNFCHGWRVQNQKLMCLFCGQRKMKKV